MIVRRMRKVMKLLTKRTMGSVAAGKGGRIMGCSSKAVNTQNESGNRDIFGYFSHLHHTTTGKVCHIERDISTTYTKANYKLFETDTWGRQA